MISIGDPNAIKGWADPLRDVLGYLEVVERIVGERASHHDFNRLPSEIETQAEASEHQPQPRRAMQDASIDRRAHSLSRRDLLPWFADVPQISGGAIARLPLSF